MRIKTTKERFWESLTPAERKLFDKETLQYIGPSDVSKNEINQKLVNEFSNQQREELYQLDLISTEQYNNAVRNFKKIAGPFVEKLQYVSETLKRVAFTDEEVWFFNIEELEIYLKDNLITNSQYFNAIKRHRFIDDLFKDLCINKNISTINKRYILVTAQASGTYQPIYDAINTYAEFAGTGETMLSEDIPTLY